MFKNVRCLTRPTQACQDTPFHRQGCTIFDARSVHCACPECVEGYVSANGAKSAKSVSPKVGKMARTPLAAFFIIPIQLKLQES